MHPVLSRIALIALLLVPATACASVDDGKPQPPLPAAALTVRTPRGPVQLQVELATTADEQERGLMYRTAMAPNAGMLFIFPSSQMLAFWMKDTILPLDIVFIRADGVISGVHDHAIPYDTTPIDSSEPVRYVLEIGAGRAAALGLAAGEPTSGPALHPGHSGH